MSRRPPEGSQWIYVADRESDIYEVLQSCPQHGVDFVIRAGQDRRLANQAGRLRAALAQAPVLGHSTVEVRARAGQPARTARVALRSGRVNLDGPWRPGGGPPPLQNVGVIEVREVDVPQGVRNRCIGFCSLPCPARPWRRRGAWWDDTRRAGGLKNITKRSRAEREWKKASWPEGIVWSH